MYTSVGSNDRNVAYEAIGSECVKWFLEIDFKKYFVIFLMDIFETCFGHFQLLIGTTKTNLSLCKNN